MTIILIFFSIDKAFADSINPKIYYEPMLWNVLAQQLRFVVSLKEKFLTTIISKFVYRESQELAKIYIQAGQTIRST